MKFTDAHLALKSGQRGDIPLAASEITLGVPPSVIVSLRDKIKALEEEREVVKSERDEERGKVKLLREQLEEKEQEIKGLYRELARLEAREDKERL